MRSSGECRCEGGFMILVPVKDLANAKQRLSPMLPQSARTELAHAMLRDVLEAVAEFSGDEVSLGTNAILRRPAALFPLRFGNDSFVPHLAAAKATGKPCVVLSLAGIGLDIDTPEDLRQLALAPRNKRSQSLARAVCAVKTGSSSLSGVENGVVTAKS